jgi:hypothetical protein
VKSTKLINEICSQFPDFGSSEFASENRDLPYVFLGNFALYLMEEIQDKSVFNMLNSLFNEALEKSEEDIQDLLVAGFMEVLNDDPDLFLVFCQNMDGHTQKLVEEYFGST